LYYYIKILIYKMLNTIKKITNGFLCFQSRMLKQILVSGEYSFQIGGFC